MLCGASPIEASSGKTVRHRLNRGGNRQANTALYRIVVVRLRWHQPTRASMARRTKQGSTLSCSLGSVRATTPRAHSVSLALAGTCGTSGGMQTKSPGPTSTLDSSAHRTTAPPVPPGRRWRCHVQRGRGLYGAIGGRSDAEQFQMALLWVLNQSDGLHSLLDVAERSGLVFGLLADAAASLAEAGLLAKVTAGAVQAGA
jgi:hypothetical protein